MILIKHFYAFILYVSDSERLASEFRLNSRTKSKPPYQPETQSRADMGQGMIAGMIWKRSCIYLLIIYFPFMTEKQVDSNR